MPYRVDDFPRIPPGTRRSSEIRSAWGGTPPATLARTDYTFWDGTFIPGGVHPLIYSAVRQLDAVFQRHQYRLDAYEPGDDWCYNRRQTKYGKVWSLHSWAIAIDVNSTVNPYSRKFITDFTPQIIADVQAIQHPNGARCWQWGGTWGRLSAKARYDTMHFQISLTPDEATTMPPPPEAAPPPAAPSPTPIPGPGVPILERVTRVERQVDLLGGIMSGVPSPHLATWLLRAALNTSPTGEQVAQVIQRFDLGETPEMVYRDLTGKGGAR